jgi:hypothetical protein
MIQADLFPYLIDQDFIKYYELNKKEMKSLDRKIAKIEINRIKDKRYSRKIKYIQSDGTFSLKTYSHYKLHKDLDNIRQELIFFHKQRKDSLKIKVDSFDFLMSYWEGKPIINTRF